MRFHSSCLLAVLPGLILLQSCAHGESEPPAATYEYKPDASKKDSQTTDGAAGANQTGPVCGDGVAEGNEQCDKGDLHGHTCETERFAGGQLACTDDCKLDTSGCDRCGDDRLDPGEECDGKAMGAKRTCADVGLGKKSELLSCTDDCKLDMSACSGCGDGKIVAPEECEPHGGPNGKADLGGKTCKDLGWDKGSLGCSDACRFDESGCSKCGDNKRSGAEECDGSDFGGKSCSDFLAPNGQRYTSGSLSCTQGCKIDLSNCMLCGDGKVTGNEVCDGSDLGGKTCKDLNFTGGKLACKSNCHGYITTGCTLCGNNQVEQGEQCDGTDLAGASCKSLGFVGGGSLACTSSCTFDTSNCTNNTCGDGNLEASEQCDCGRSGTSCTSSQLGGKSCTDLSAPNGSKYTGGTLGCHSPFNCRFDTSGCYYCGDGKRNGQEACDGNDLNGKSCRDLGFSSGTLRCTSQCTFDTQACVRTPNPLELCVTPDVDIPDNNDNGVTSTITVPDSKSISKVEVSLDIVHAWVGDVTVKLTHGSTTRTLVDRPGHPTKTLGCGGKNIDAWFRDGASETAENTCHSPAPALGGSLRPNEALGDFAGQDMKGTWTLRVIDSVTQDTGTLRKWCVKITWQ